MNLKSTVDAILKKKNRTFSWLAAQMDRTFDGLKLSLTTGSIKHRDMELMAKILEVSPLAFFSEPLSPLTALTVKSPGTLLAAEYNELRLALKSCKELNAALKGQIKDKDKIIALLTKG
ncbi:hypothetical protein [Pedobacter gandavensis]|uniref:hypothetical protein n=1 Tax=Pedobacter gandavensis TaxID=2679963 RepID=UPI002930AAF8|nr:hypothetical protein [Pedobacter gandavensis]